MVHLQLMAEAPLFVSALSLRACLSARGLLSDDRCSSALLEPSVKPGEQILAGHPSQAFSGHRPADPTQSGKARLLREE